MALPHEIDRDFAQKYLSKYGINPAEVIEDGWDSYGYRTWDLITLRFSRKSWPDNFNFEAFYEGCFAEKYPKIRCSGCGSSEFKTGRCVYCRSYR